ncbi:MAG: hypothetical protein EBU08_13025 [Micrococcales bacterium]|nr:hypothetical protein [Micrococcales bacterium]
MATNGGGFTNNFISLKTLVERLQYGRDQLIKFWDKELEIVRKAMGFRHKAYIQFDQMSLSDEASEKALLIQLADRDIISQETLLQRFKEIPQIEKIRLQREVSDRQDDKNPNKAGPFHSPQHKEDLEKVALQSGKVLPQDVGLKTSVPKDVLVAPKASPSGGTGIAPAAKPSNPNGRPQNSQDSNPRKQRIAKPKSTPGIAELMVWSEESWDYISENLTDAFLNTLGKKNSRQLTKAEVVDLEQLKLDIFTNIEPMTDVNAEIIRNLLVAQKKTPNNFKELLISKGISLDSMSMEKYRRNTVGTYVEYVSNIDE